MPCIHYYNRPKVLQRPEVIGVFSDGCVQNDFCDAETSAHAHISPGEPFEGWICFIKSEAIKDKMLCLHELAHIITKHHHDDVWRKALLNLGGTLEANFYMKPYFKKSRKRY